MNEYSLAELGYFSETECKNLKRILEDKTFMHFHIAWSNYAGNCTLIIKTDYEDSEDAIKNFFLGFALSELARVRR